MVFHSQKLPIFLYNFKKIQTKAYSKGAQGLSVQLYLTASSRLFQFHGNNSGDSGAVVTPFMRDGTYPPRNFATLGPSGLRPPFTGNYYKSVDLCCLTCSTGQASDFIHRFTTWQNLMFLLNSRHSLFYDTVQVLFIPKLQSQFAEFLQNYYFLRFHLLINLHVFELVRLTIQFFSGLQF